MFIVMHKSAKMPSSCKGIYRRIGVVEISDDFNGEPSMISSRAKGIRRIIRTWEKLHAGTMGGNTAFDRAMREAKVLVEDLNRA